MKIDNRMMSNNNTVKDADNNIDDEIKFTNSSVKSSIHFWLPTSSSTLEDDSNEIGFINSQPLMAEFMTNLPHHSPNEMDSHNFQTEPSNKKQSTFNPNMKSNLINNNNNNNNNTPEYPWMKEKKSTRKNNLQGKHTSKYCFILFYFHSNYQRF